jgi:hypothetical protein
VRPVAAHRDTSQRALLFAVTAAAGLLMAGGGFVAAATLDVFYACRGPYRFQPAVEGSLACQSYYALVMFSKLLSFAACGLAVVAGILWLARRRARN